MEGAPRKRAVPLSTEIERFGVPFDTRRFARERKLSIEAMGQALGIKGTNFHNWAKADTVVPLSVVKAILLLHERDNLPSWEQKFDGKIIRAAKNPWRVSTRVLELAGQYNELRQGVRLRTTTNEVLEIPVLAPPQLHLMSSTEETAILDLASPSSPEPVAEPAPVAEPPMTRVEIPTAFGALLVDMPQLAMSVGEREIYTNLCLRLNHQVSVLVAEKRQLELKLAAADERASSQSRRIQELVKENKEYDELFHYGVKEQTPTLEKLTAPKHANLSDYTNAKNAVKVPALVSMIEDMSKGFPKGTHVS
jgi:hypothetical protein